MWKSSLIFVVLFFTSVILFGSAVGEDFSDRSDSGSDVLQNSAGVSTDQEEGDSASAKILRDIAKMSGVEISEIEKTEFVWTTNGPGLQMVNPRKMSIKDASPSELKKIESFFVDGGWDDGEQFFKYVGQKNETGYAAPYEGEYRSAMCVVDMSLEEVRCGFGPGGEDK